MSAGGGFVLLSHEEFRCWVVRELEEKGYLGITKREKKLAKSYKIDIPEDKILYVDEDDDVYRKRLLWNAGRARYA